MATITNTMHVPTAARRIGPAGATRHRPWVGRGTRPDRGPGAGRGRLRSNRRRRGRASVSAARPAGRRGRLPAAYPVCRHGQPDRGARRRAGRHLARLEPGAGGNRADDPGVCLRPRRHGLERRRPAAAHPGADCRASCTPCSPTRASPVPTYWWGTRWPARTCACLRCSTPTRSPGWCWWTRGASMWTPTPRRPKRQGFQQVLGAQGNMYGADCAALGIVRLIGASQCGARRRCATRRARRWPCSPPGSAGIDATAAEARRASSRRRPAPGGALAGRPAADRPGIRTRT